MSTFFYDPFFYDGFLGNWKQDQTMCADRSPDDEMTRVRQFHSTFGFPTQRVPSDKTILIRATMIHEECKEFLTATTREAIRDLVVDLFYFLYGALVEMGATPAHKIIWVCKNNPSNVPNADERMLWSVAIQSSIEDYKMTMETCLRVQLITEVLNYMAKIAVACEISYETFLKDFRAIHKANMDKVWLKTDAVALTMRLTRYGGHYPGEAHYIDSEGNLFSFQERFTGFIVKRNGKVQKPPGWKAAQLEVGL